MDFLERIVAQKRVEVEKQKQIIPLDKLEKSIYFNRSSIAVKNRFLNYEKPGIIAEFKRKSPSKGVINDQVSVESVTCGYADHGALVLSVLTDYHFFGGSAHDLVTARKLNDIPVLRKDFIIDPYQLYEAKAWGADLVLLIAACLTKEQVRTLADLAHQLGMEVLFEIHNRTELDKFHSGIDLVGVNNRNLKTFEVDWQTSLDVLPDLPHESIPITESGISSPDAVKQLWQAGYKGFLIGENFMKTNHPPQSLHIFINQLIQ